MFGHDNLLPNKLMKWVLNSGTAKRSVSKRSAYISADGFVDDNAANFQVNPIQTADKIVTEISGYQSYFKGFCLHVKRTPEIQLTVLPFQCVRKTLDGNFIFNPTFNDVKYDKNADIKISAFKGAKLTPQQLLEVKENGEIIYAYHRNADNPHYPIPDYYAGIEDVRTSSELQKLDFESVVNGFIPSAILTFVGELDDEVEDENGKTEADYFNESLNSFTGAEKNADGVSGRMRALVNWVRTKDEIPSLQAYDAKSIIDASNSKREIIDRSVCRLFGVHPTLIGFADAAILGNQQAMANASNELSNDVVSDQQLITEVFAMVYPEIKNWDLTSFKPISYIPDKILDDLTVDERRALVGYAPTVINTDTPTV